MVLTQDGCSKLVCAPYGTKTSLLSVLLSRTWPLLMSVKCDSSSSTHTVHSSNVEHNHKQHEVQVAAPQRRQLLQEEELVDEQRGTDPAVWLHVKDVVVVIQTVVVERKRKEQKAARATAKNERTPPHANLGRMHHTSCSHTSSGASITQGCVRRTKHAVTCDATAAGCPKPLGGFLGQMARTTPES